MIAKICTLVAILIVNSVALQTCRQSLLRKCLCGKGRYYDQEQYIVNCTDTQFTDTDMLTNLPEETQVLIFTGNHIRELPWNLLGELKDLSSLKVIDMSNNGIEEIKGKTYHHVSNVERLILNHNNLTVSDKGDENFHHPRIFSNFVNLLELHLTNAFADNTDAALANDLHDIFVNSNLTKLYKIHLEQNEIKAFRDEYVFCDLPNLRDLYLGDNYIPQINFNISCMKKLRFLDLENNNITTLTAHDMQTLDRQAYPYKDKSESLVIDITGNPLQCTSTIKDFYRWVLSTNVIIRNRENLRCIQTKKGSKYFINLQKMVNAEEAHVSGVITILVIVLLLSFLTPLALFIYISKDALKHRLTPLLEVINRKVHYTTIESQEV